MKWRDKEKQTILIYRLEFIHSQVKRKLKGWIIQKVKNKKSQTTLSNSITSDCEVNIYK